jgi:ubiquinone biosynthesis protein
VEELRDRYYEVPLRTLNLAQIVQDVFSLAYRHRVRIPMDFTLLGKCLVTLEGVIQLLDPELSMVELARPFGATLVRERLSPARVAARGRRRARSWLEILERARACVASPERPPWRPAASRRRSWPARRWSPARSGRT